MLASGPGGPDQSLGIWTISVVGGQSRKIRDDAWLATPSPDGSLVAFISADYREIWLIKSNGEEPRRLAAVEAGATFFQVAWSPDGQRLAYLKTYSLESKRQIESCDLDGTHTSLIWSDQRLKNFCWTSRGRIIATLSESQAGGPSRSNLWALDVQAVRPTSPKQLTRFAGFTPFSLSVTADGKQLALVRNYDQSDVYVGDLEANGARLSAPRRLTLDDRVDWPGGWTRDSKALLFYSDRSGTLDIYRQKPADRTPELLLAGSDEKRQPQVSPDGASVVYLAWPKMSGDALPAAGKVMFFPLAGGPPQFVLDAKGYPGSAQTPRELGTRVLTTAGHPDIRCPRLAGSSCVLSETEPGKVIFSSLDTGNGKRTQLIAVEAGPSSFWDLSPDGSRIALGEIGRNDRIRILPLAGGESRKIPVKDFRLVASVGWSADGASLFLTGTAPEGGSIIRHLFPDGRSQLLYKADAWLERPLASPDGRSLAFGQATSSNNVWTIENF